jgi:hypothetical protein
MARKHGAAASRTTTDRAVTTETVKDKATRLLAEWRGRRRCVGR